MKKKNVGILVITMALLGTVCAMMFQLYGLVVAADAIYSTHLGKNIVD